LGLLVCVVASLLGALPVSARAADYLTDRDGNKISFANLDGSVGGTWPLPGPPSETVALLAVIACSSIVAVESVPLAE
jgi:hypothetical protein